MKNKPNELFFSQLQGKKIYDGEGKPIGKLKDLVVMWDGEVPRVTGIRHTNDIHKLLPTSEVSNWNDTGINLLHTIDQIQVADIRPEELYVGKWLLDKQIIDLKGTKLVRVNDILLSCTEQGGGQHLSLIAADIGIRGLFRRIGMEFLVGNLESRYISWHSITPLETKTGNLKLNKDKSELNKLHPADIADLVEEMDYHSRAAFIKSLDTERAAEALAEMELDTQVELISQLEGGHASDLLEEMPPDEAADILGEMSAEKSTELLQLMETDDAEEVKGLMQYEDDTAGGLMTTECIAIPDSLTAEQTINHLREIAPSAETIYYLYVVDAAKKLLGVLSLRELIIASPETTLSSLMHRKVIAVHYNDSQRKVAEVIRKYSLLAVPVADEQGVLMGIITVDDVMDLLMPERSMADAMTIYLNKRVVRRG